MLRMILDLFGVILLAASVGIIVCFTVRMLCCLFSASSRKKVRDRPVLHAVWCITSILTAVWWYSVLTTLHGCTSDKGHCKMEVVMVVRAMQGIHEKYGRFPLQSEAVDHAYGADQALLLQILSGAGQPPSENPEGIRFIELSEEDTGARGMLDPWGNPMHIVADWSGDGRVSVGAKVLDEKVAVWSDGPDGKNESGSGDDITSW